MKNKKYAMYDKKKISYILKKIFILEWKLKKYLKTIKDEI